MPVSSENEAKRFVTQFARKSTLDPQKNNYQQFPK